MAASFPIFNKLNLSFIFSACLRLAPNHCNKLDLSQSKVCLRFFGRFSEKQQSNIFILYTRHRFSKFFSPLCFSYFCMRFVSRNIVICHFTVDIVFVPNTIMYRKYGTQKMPLIHLLGILISKLKKKKKIVTYLYQNVEFDMFWFFNSWEMICLQHFYNKS